MDSEVIETSETYHLRLLQGDKAGTGEEGVWKMIDEVGRGRSERE